MPNAERIFFLALAFQRGWTVEEVFELTKVDRWFLENISRCGDQGGGNPQNDRAATARWPACRCDR
ncbi:MAG: hypothetical protein QM796_04620 [Chthoniobacteraceae bacterium]